MIILYQVAGIVPRLKPKTLPILTVYNCEQEQDQNTCRPMIQQQPVIGVDSAQTLMLLPFEIMRQRLEAVMLRQLETATRIYARRAEELNNTFMTHIDKFEMTVKRVQGIKQ